MKASALLALCCMGCAVGSTVSNTPPWETSSEGGEDAPNYLYPTLEAGAVDSGVADTNATWAVCSADLLPCGMPAVACCDPTTFHCQVSEEGGAMCVQGAASIEAGVNDAGGE